MSLRNGRRTNEDDEFVGEVKDFREPDLEGGRMGDSGGARMEGWVYYLSSSKLRLNHPRKRYLVLAGNRASSFKDKPRAGDEVLLGTLTFAWKLNYHK